MSESEQHRSLVLAVRDRLSVVYANASIAVDIQSTPGTELPSKIAGYRPDVFIRDDAQTVIAEAKTGADLDRNLSQNCLNNISSEAS